jgi:hypothetical protein
MLETNFCREVHQENCSIQADGKDADVVEDLEEEFLNLDDVPGDSKCNNETMLIKFRYDSCQIITH